MKTLTLEESFKLPGGIERERDLIPLVGNQTCYNQNPQTSRS